MSRVRISIIDKHVAIRMGVWESERQREKQDLRGGREERVKPAETGGEGR